MKFNTAQAEMMLAQNRWFFLYQFANSICIPCGEAFIVSFNRQILRPASRTIPIFYILFFHHQVIFSLSFFPDNWSIIDHFQRFTNLLSICGNSGLTMGKIHVGDKKNTLWNFTDYSIVLGIKMSFCCVLHLLNCDDYIQGT